MSLVLTRSSGLARHRPPFKGSCEGPILVRSSNTTLPKWVTAVCMDEMPASCTTTSHEPWACTRRNLPTKLTTSSGTSPTAVMISKTSNTRKIFKAWLEQHPPAMSLLTYVQSIFDLFFFLIFFVFFFFFFFFFFFWASVPTWSARYEKICAMEKH